MYGHQTRCATACLEHLANPVAWRFWRHHADIHPLRRFDGAKADVETVSKHERLARPEVWRDLPGKDGRLRGVGRQQHDRVCPRSHLRGRTHLEAGRLRLLPRLAALSQAHADGDAAIPQVQGVSVSLRTKSDDGNVALEDELGICVVVIVDGGHKALISSPG